ncbi:hypothetical protein [uncultured Methylibium sp.]|jgi:hypothetical protein|uniref:hypothetical protein n=1 Tax=Ramlibacter sp. TaxID=1917967 RepID=UPI0025FB443B|nr:hypothetical protein [uncultured Methylibium sp.]
MKLGTPQPWLTMMMLCIWVAIVLAGVVAYRLFRWWRKQHPLPKPPPERSYSESLQQRLAAARRAGDATSRRRSRRP